MSSYDEMHSPDFKNWESRSKPILWFPLPRTFQNPQLFSVTLAKPKWWTQCRCPSLWIRDLKVYWQMSTKMQTSHSGTWASSLSQRVPCAVTSWLALTCVPYPSVKWEPLNQHELDYTAVWPFYACSEEFMQEPLHTKARAYSVLIPIELLETTKTIPHRFLWEINTDCIIPCCQSSWL